jgi:hypothetical protein
MANECNGEKNLHNPNARYVLTSEKGTLEKPFASYGVDHFYKDNHAT